MATYLNYGSIEAHALSENGEALPAYGAVAYSSGAGIGLLINGGDVYRYRDRCVRDSQSARQREHRVGKQRCQRQRHGDRDRRNGGDRLPRTCSVLARE